MIRAIGKRIAMLRRNAGLSQATLAEQLGVSPRAIGMYEQGRREPPLDTIVSISVLFGVTTDYLLTGHIQNMQDWSAIVGSNWETILRFVADLLQENCDRV